MKTMTPTVAHKAGRPKVKPESAKKGRRLTVQEAGRRGGLTTLENQGRDFFSQIGKKGGERTAELYRDLLSQFGQRGGRPRRPTLDQYMGEGDR